MNVECKNGLQNIKSWLQSHPGKNFVCENISHVISHVNVYIFQRENEQGMYKHPAFLCIQPIERILAAYA